MTDNRQSTPDNQSDVLFAQIDFVEFIRRRDLFLVNMSALMEMPIFKQAVFDFKKLGIRLGQAAARVKSAIPDNELVKGQIWRGDLSKAIVLAGYFCELPQVDPRYVSLLSFDSGLSENRPTGSDPYKEYSAFPTHGEDLDSWSLRRLDERDYLVHWARAYPAEFAAILSRKRLMARIISAHHHSADDVAKILFVAVNEMELDLPHLDFLLKQSLLGGIGVLCQRGLLKVEFNAVEEFPEYF